ncbi:hypothetical protein KKC65_02610 [Patescibacteria group bacterium]|nr:hypothetical protein [Patescibacteria group bacterium]
MITEEQLQQTRQTIREFFEKTGFDIEIEILTPDDRTIPVNISTDDPKVLIGQNGQTLADVQHLLKAMLSRRISEQFYIDLDINNYKKKKIAYIKENAREWANEVSLNREDKMLSPMPSYERRVIHMELANRSDVRTESAGQGIDRFIIIRPT